MAWSPADDPWGAGLLASGAVFGASLLLALVRRTPGPTWMTGLGASAFLVCAGLGAQQPAPSPDRPATQDGTPTRAADVSDTQPAAPPKPQPKDGPAEPPPPEPEAEEPPAAPGSAIPTPAPLPASGAERRAAIRSVLRNARLTYESDENCKQPEALGKAWAAVAALPEEAQTPRAGAVVKRLEACRRKTRWATTYTVHRDRVAARDAFEDILKKRLSTQHQVTASIVVSGKDHERIRVGSGAFDDATVARILDDALEAELAELGFERAVFASPSKSWKTKLKPQPESAYVDAVLEPYGLHRKLSF